MTKEKQTQVLDLIKELETKNEEFTSLFNTIVDTALKQGGVRVLDVVNKFVQQTKERQQVLNFVKENLDVNEKSKTN